MNSRIVKTLILVILVTIPGVTYAFAHITRCAFIEFSDFNEIENQLYVSGVLPTDAHEEISALVQNARLRISEYYGEPKATPTIIVTGSDQEAKSYGLNDSPGILFIVPWNSYLVLNYQKKSVDVASHELVHAELLERLGYFKRQQEIPTWFDEGAALQVDFRSHYLIDLDTFDQSEILRVRTLDSPKKFWSNNKKQNILNYQAAKAAVATYFKDHSTNFLYPMLVKIKNGEKFEALFNEAN